MFGQLADPEGANNALSQVLYGLALRFAIPTAFASCPLRQGKILAYSSSIVR
jgi:hypothetical protein